MRGRKGVKMGRWESKNRRQFVDLKLTVSAPLNLIKAIIYYLLTYYKNFDSENQKFFYFDQKRQRCEIFVDLIRS